MITDNIKRFFFGSYDGDVIRPQYDTGFVGSTNTGITITQDSAMSFSAVFACINIIADTVASLPFQVFKTTRNGKLLARGHPMYSILHDAPSKIYTSYTFRYVIMQHLLLRGNAYAAIQRDGDQNVQGFTILDPTRISIKSKNGEIYYEYGKVVYNWTDILHFMILSSDGLVGKSPITFARENIGLGLAAERYGQNFFGAENIKNVIEVPFNARKEKTDQLKQSLQETHGGLQKSHGTLILKGGAKFTNVTIPLDDSQFIQTRTFQLLEIARMYRVPPHKLGELEKSSYSTNEQAEIAYLQDTIRPILVNIEQEINRKIWKIIEYGTYYAEFNMAARLRGDVSTRTSYYQTMRTIGAMTADEVRALENFNALTKKQKEELAREKANVTIYGNVDDVDNQETNPQKETVKNDTENENKNE